MGKLYKYISFEKPERFLDILLNNRLYGAIYTELNDPMEGHFAYTLLDKNESLREQILAKSARTSICSLSKRDNIGLMWTHYANEGKGCCIEVEVTDSKWKRLDIKYSDELPPATNVETVLTTKGTAWKYEEEVRYLNTPDQSKTGRERRIKVKITKVIFGYQTPDETSRIFKKLIQTINKTRRQESSKIEVKKIKKEDLDYKSTDFTRARRQSK